MRISDWSSDVCSSDLTGIVPHLFYLLHHSLSETADQFQTSVIVYPVITQLMKTLRAGTLQSRRKTSRIIADAIIRIDPENLWRKRSCSCKSILKKCISTRPLHNKIRHDNDTLKNRFKGRKQLTKTST